MTYPPGHRNTRVELLPSKRLESLDTELQPGLNKLDIGSFPQRIVHNALILVDRY
jgi:hypothetical protein